VFTFAKDEFPDRKSLFDTLAATYMIPGQLSPVPRFVTMAEFGRCGFFRRQVMAGALVSAIGNAVNASTPAPYLRQSGFLFAFCRPGPGRCRVHRAEKSARDMPELI
jgi:hypothetical protein